MTKLLEAIAQAISEPQRENTTDRLLVDLFRRHLSENGPYGTYCRNLGATAETVTSWRQIPAVPAAAFRRFDLTCVATDRCASVFYSSGTTSTQSSKHWMDADALRLYELSLKCGFARAIGPLMSIVALMPDTLEAPHSSLSHMAGTLGVAQWGWGDSICSALESAQAGNCPVIIFGTAFAFAMAFQTTSSHWILPRGSKIIETGGFKGRVAEIPKPELYALFRERFGVDDKDCYSEYGMCELSSQFYSNGAEGQLVGPPWLRHAIIDPRTGEDVSAGEPGLIRLYDLANWNSVVAVQTQDIAVDAGGGFKIIGRSPAADVRGCSLTAEEIWSHRNAR